jgi:hypothetical protein
LGLKLGQFASARISPLRGSMTSAVPPAARFSSTPARSSRSATCCRYWSIVSSIVAPVVGGRSMRLKA